MEELLKEAAASQVEWEKQYNQHKQAYDQLVQMVSQNFDEHTIMQGTLEKTEKDYKTAQKVIIHLEGENKAQVKSLNEQNEDLSQEKAALEEDNVKLRAELEESMTLVHLIKSNEEGL